MDDLRSITIPPPLEQQQDERSLEEQLLDAHEAVAIFLGQTVENWTEKGWDRHSSALKAKTEADLYSNEIAAGVKVTLELTIWSKPDGSS